jgi:hypothetical protein
VLTRYMITFICHFITLATRVFCSTNIALNHNFAPSFFLKLFEFLNRFIFFIVGIFCEHEISIRLNHFFLLNLFTWMIVDHHILSFRGLFNFSSKLLICISLGNVMRHLVEMSVSLLILSELMAEWKGYIPILLKY